MTDTAAYPDLGQMPEHQLMSACEVLCWIGYSRAISKELYFTPFVVGSGSVEERLARIHAAVPDLKPNKCPIGEAEAALMNALRDDGNGRIEPLIGSPGKYEVVAPELLDFAMAVNVRGSIEVDQGASERDQDTAVQARSLHTLGELRFRRIEVLKRWPRGGFSTSVSDDDGTPLETAPPLFSGKDSFDEQEAKALLAAAKLTTWKGCAPIFDEAMAFLAPRYSNVPREPLRRLCRQLWPGQFRRGRPPAKNRPATY